MTTIIITIVLTLIFDWGLGYLVHYNKKKQLKRDKELFILKLEQKLINGTRSAQDRLGDSLELCRMTKGEFSAGVYTALDITRLKL